MALITLRGFLFDELGNGVGDIEVAAHAKNSDGTLVGTPAASTTSSSTTGKWEIINLDTTDAPETGVFTIVMTNPATSQVRRVEGDTRMMFGQVIGASGGAPLANSSILQVHLLDGIVNDAKMGTRVIDDAIVTAYSDTGTLTQIVSWFGKQLRAIIGSDDWHDTPATSLATAATHIASTANPHSVTATQVAALSNALGITSFRAGTFAARPSAATAGSGATYIATDAAQMYYSNGSSWSPVPAIVSQTFSRMEYDGDTAIADIIDDTFEFIAGTGIDLSINTSTNTLTITNSAPSGGSANAFGTVAVSGQTSAVADQANDTLTLVAGHGVDLTTSGDSVTVTVDETELTGSLISGVGISNVSGESVLAASQTLTSNGQVVDLITHTSLPAGTYLFSASIRYWVQQYAGHLTFGLKKAAVYETTQLLHTTDLFLDTSGIMGTVSGSWIRTLSSTTTVSLFADSQTASDVQVMDDDTWFSYVRLS